MAPEVFAGGTISPRTDVFGLAATLWTLIAGKAPVYADPTRLSSVVAEVSSQLEQTIMAGLEMIPDRRRAVEPRRPRTPENTPQPHRALPRHSLTKTPREPH